MIDIRQSFEYANYLKKEGWITERIENTNYFIKKLPLVGSVIKIQRPEEINFKTTEKLCKKYRVFRVILEPKLTSSFGTIKGDHNLLISHGFKLSKSPYLPSKTLQIDLTQPISKITANFKKDARLALRKTKDLGFKIYDWDSLEGFRNSWKKAVGFKRYVPTLKSLIDLYASFSPKKLIMLASHNTGAIFLRTKDTAYYWQAFTSKEGRASLSQYSLVYQGILWAKRMGCKVFDFEGIFDERFPNKSWLGFTHFKKSFGGYEVLYLGCYTKFRFPYFDR